MKNIRILATVVVALGAASSQARPAGTAAAWSVMSGETTGYGNTVFWGQGGFPGFSATLLHGIADKVDLGGRFSFTYGYGETPSAIYPGLKAQGVARVQLADTGKVRFALHFEPGMVMYFISRPAFFGGTYTQVGIALPAGLEIGIPISREVVFNVGMDIPLFIVFGDASGAVVPILFGGGVEYFFDPKLALTFALKGGPQIYTRGGGADFGLNALLGIAMKF